MYSDGFVRSSGSPGVRSEPITGEHEKLAAAMQRVFEETVTRLLTDAPRTHRARRRGRCPAAAS